jgi:DUF4097 and DUF4098 domain-containing protein YvlB
LTRLVFDEFEASDIVVKTMGGPNRQLVIERNFKWTGSEKPGYSETWSGDTLTISHNCGNSSSDDCSVKYTVTIPEPILAGVTVQAETASGDLWVLGIPGAVKLSTVSGDLHTEGLSGTQELQTVSGDLKVTESKSANVKAKTVSGDLTLSFFTAPKDISGGTTSGDLIIEVPSQTGPYRVQAKSVSGDHRVTVDTSASSPLLVDVQTTSGDLTVRYR